MMKTFSAYAIFSLCAVSAFAQGAGMKQYKSIDGKDWVCTTNAVTLTAAEAARRVAGDVAGTNHTASATNAVTVVTDAKLALKMNITGGTSTNQTLFSPVVTNKLGFGTAFADALVAGEVAWDPDWMTFRAGVGDGVTGQFFQESHIYAKNVSGQTVTNGMAVRFSGVVGNSGKCEFVLAKAEVGVRPATTLGIATHDIANGALGKITWFGNVNAIDTTGALYGETGWTNNMIVYLSTNTPGFLTRFEPQAPQPRISLGAVINAHKNAGTILVRPTWGMRVTEADDVDGTPLTASGQIMVWDQARGVFDFTDNIGNYISEAEGVSSLKDSQDTNFFQTVENGTGTVWRISTVTNYQVTLSANFLETDTSTRPAWTNHAWPFSEDGWYGTEEAGNLILSYPDNSAFWVGAAGTYPSVLIPDDAGTAQGTAVVSQLVSHVTNAVSTYATDARVDGLESDLSDVVADVAAIALTTNQVNLQPFVKVAYGDFLTTNVVGYTGFLTTNAATAERVTASTSAGTSLAKFRYDLCAYTYGTASFSGWVQAAAGAPTNQNVFVQLSAFTASGVSIVSNNGAKVEIPQAHYSNVTATVYIPNAVTNGYVVAEIFGATNSSVGARVLSGGIYPAALALNVKPLNYTTIAETDAKYPAINGGTLTNVTLAGTVTIGGVARTDWPVGGGETSIIAPLYESGTNVTVTSTQSVYSVAVTGAGPVGIDWSGLALDGTGRAEILLRLNVTEWGGTNVTFSPALTFDQTPEILVTGVWEFAASTVNGTVTRVRQTWPECCGWQDVGNLVSGSYVQWTAATNASAEFNLVPGLGGVIYKFKAKGTTSVPVYASYFYDYFGARVLLRENVLINNGGTWYLAFCPSSKAAPDDSNYVTSRFYIDKYGEGQAATTAFTAFWRPANVNERAAYDAGWRP